MTDLAALFDEPTTSSTKKVFKALDRDLVDESGCEEQNAMLEEAFGCVTEKEKRDALFSIFKGRRDQARSKGMLLQVDDPTTCLIYKPLKNPIGKGQHKWKIVPSDALKAWIEAYNREAERDAERMF